MLTAGMQRDMEFAYQLSIGRRIEENNGKPRQSFTVAGPSGRKLTSSHKPAFIYTKPTVSPRVCIHMLLRYFWELLLVPYGKSIDLGNGKEECFLWRRNGTFKFVLLKCHMPIFGHFKSLSCIMARRAHTGIVFTLHFGQTAHYLVYWLKLHLLVPRNSSTQRVL